MEQQVLAVTTISSYLKQILENDMLLRRVKVFGEISGLNVSNKVVYFSLKDENALLNCVSFYYQDFNDFKIGDKVIVQGSPNYYLKNGRLSFNVEKIELFGEGELYKNFLLLKQKLESEGLFDIERKKPFPSKINKIGVVTSETGAVIQDIINVSTRRNSQINIVLFPVKVQGLLAENTIVKGINYFSGSDVDAIIVGRGGGSEEDLQCFNQEIVVRAIADCKKFVVSAVGHETNYTLTDFVADLRAPTPSAAAELLVKEQKSYYQNFKEYYEKFNNEIFDKLENEYRKNIDFSSEIEYLISKRVDKEENLLTNLIKDINRLNPLEIIAQGYSKLEKNNKKISSTKEINVGDEIVCNLIDGKIIASVKEIDKI